MVSYFITGVSSGIGAAIANLALARGDRVTGLSRRCPADLVARGLEHWAIDLSQRSELAECLRHRIPLSQADWSIVILNAAILGPISDLKSLDVDDMQPVLETNVWANKTLIDHLLRKESSVKQVVAISSGAAIEGKRGLGAYCLSKTMLQMLVQLYSQEFPETHFTSLMPGTVDTPMQDALCEVVDEARFPIVATLKARRASSLMSTVNGVAQRILAQIPFLPQRVHSGDHVHLDAIAPRVSSDARAD